MLYQFFGTYPNTECHPKPPEWRFLHNRGSLQHSPATATRGSTVTVCSGAAKHELKNKMHTYRTVLCEGFNETITRPYLKESLDV